jgi:hypothetical protein
VRIHVIAVPADRALGSSSVSLVSRLTGERTLGVGFTALHRPGQIKCFSKDPAVFVDFSVAESSRAKPDMHLWRLEGMAHDSVVTVGMIGKRGQILAKVPVREGIYYLPSPSADPIGKIVAYDAQGHILDTQVE